MLELASMIFCRLSRFELLRLLGVTRHAVLDGKECFLALVEDRVGSTLDEHPSHVG